MKLKLILTAVISSVFLLSPKFVFAGFGISPADFINEYLRPGTSYSKEFTIMRSDTDEDLEITIEPDMGEVNDWLEFKPDRQFVLKKGKARQVITITVNTPEDADEGPYPGYIRVYASPKEKEKSGVSIVKGVRIDVDFIATRLEVTKLIVRGLEIADVTGGNPIRLKIFIENEGNTSAAPERAELEIQNLNQETLEVVEDTELELIAPSEQKDIYAEFGTDLDVGEYYALARIYDNSQVLREERLVFRILEKSAEGRKELSKRPIISFGQLEDIFNDARNLMAFAGLSIAVAVIVLLLVKKKVVSSSLVWPILAVLGLSLIAAYIIIDRNSGKANEIQKNIEEALNTPTPTLTEEDQQAEVKGVVEEANEDLEIPQVGTDNSFTVSGPEVKGEYYVYEKPDENSSIIYTATENESFGVLDEKAEWYLVEITDNTSGWLPKRNIKSSN